MAVPSEKTANAIVAVLDIGASAIRMTIAEIAAGGEIHVLETPAKPVSIGRDVFTTGRISRTTRREVIDVLAGFKRLMEGYQVSHSRVVATSALREAGDRDTFLDWVFVRTGIDIEVIEGFEENQLTFAAVQDVLGERLSVEPGSLIMEVGGGSTELMLLHAGEIVLSQTLPLGAVRMQQRPDILEVSPSARRRLIRREVGGAIENIVRQFDLSQVGFFVSLGADLRFVAAQLHSPTPQAPAESGPGQPGQANAMAGRVAAVPTGVFRKFADEVGGLSVDELVDRFNIPFADAETLSPALMIYATFLAATAATELTVPMVSLRDGLLLELAGQMSGRRDGGFPRQVVAAARALGVKYNYDEKHANHVTKLALQLFDELHEEHQLGSRERLMLEVAGILHDIGVFIGNTAHHKHGRYIICESDLFGLRKAEKEIIADVVRYHRKATPRPTHLEYMSLPRADRVVVSKLAALLRVADALDRAHLQRIKDVRFDRRRDNFVLVVPTAEDLSVERSGLRSKGDLFEDVFGFTVVLEEAPATG